MTPYIISAVLLALLTLGVVMFSQDAKVAPEVPPAEEQPYIPAQISLTLVKHKTQMVTADRPLPNEYYRGKTIERICWDLSEGVER